MQRILKSRRVQRDARGAALVEFATILPLLLLVGFGSIQWGFAYRDSLSLATAARTATRTGISMGTDPSADWQILRAVKGSTANLSAISQVIVYKSTSADGTVPAACFSGAVAGVCNVYSSADFNLTETEFKASSFTKDDSWAAASRKIKQSDPPDYLGVYIKGTHNSVVRTLWQSQTLSDRAVQRFDQFTVVPTTTTTAPVTTTTTVATTTTTKPPTTTTTVATTTTTKPPTTTTTVATTTTTKAPATTTTAALATTTTTATTCTSILMPFGTCSGGGTGTTTTTATTCTSIIAPFGTCTGGGTGTTTTTLAGGGTGGGTGTTTTTGTTCTSIIAPFGTCTGGTTSTTVATTTTTVATTTTTKAPTTTTKAPTTTTTAPTTTTTKPPTTTTTAAPTTTTKPPTTTTKPPTTTTTVVDL